MTSTLQAARALSRRDPVAGWTALNEVFRAGEIPSQLSGRYQGALIQVRIAPGLTELATALTKRWLPWRGKRFDAATQSGDNIFSRNWLRLARVVWPIYAGYVADTPDTYRAFRFQTRAETGLFDRDRKVLVLNYDLAGNPPANIRRIRDEVIQLEDGSFLGKAHIHWYWGSWQTVAYFSLTEEDAATLNGFDDREAVSDVPTEALPPTD